MIFGAGFVLLGLVGLIVQLRRPALAAELLAMLVATRAGRVLTVLVWGWLGWHFLAR
ncbi:DUF6186 family protein [Actinophytocola sp. NPDC049390]|uniref:DUF6186 family protein n=1 Tax=Actinophytocola sp. NPDC049390 TaxID=3363894 RepID=UPI00378D8D0E